MNGWNFLAFTPLLILLLPCVPYSGGSPGTPWWVGGCWDTLTFRLHFSEVAAVALESQEETEEGSKEEDMCEECPG